MFCAAFPDEPGRPGSGFNATATRLTHQQIGLQQVQTNSSRDCTLRKCTTRESSVPDLPVSGASNSRVTHAPMVVSSPASYNPSRSIALRPRGSLGGGRPPGAVSRLGMHYSMEFANVIRDLRPDLDAVEERLRTAADLNFPELGAIIETLIGSGGKRLRPVMLLLCARPFNYQLGQLLSAAAGIELLHTASLVHDDTIDRAQLRRGTPTLNSMFDTGTVIMLGDYLFARSAMLAADTMNPRVVAVFASTLGHICDGQLHEILTAHSLEQTREDYERRIFGKTASLFAGAAEMGAILGEATDPDIAAMREYGSDVGMAFQIIDDVLDLRGTTEEIGKPAGLDLRQGTITLPTMIFMARENGSSVATEVRRIVNGGNATDDELRQVAETIRASGALDEAVDRAHMFVDRARKRIAFIEDEYAVTALNALAESALIRSS